MDPKSFPQNLDPKLKEAYDRVMGFAAKPTQTPPASQVPSSPSRPDPAGINQAPPISSTPTPAFTTPSQTTVKPPEIAAYPKPQQPMQYEAPPVGQAKPVPYQTESFSNNPIHIETQTTQPKSIPYQPVTQEPQFPPISQLVSPSPITEPAAQPPSVPQAVTQQPEKKSSLLTIVIIVLGIIFLLIYTFFWIRFLDVALPFDLPF